MKMKPLKDSTVTAPEKNANGTWSFQEFPPLGGDIYHGDYPTRSAARLARAEVVAGSKGSGVRAEVQFKKW